MKVTKDKFPKVYHRIEDAVNTPSTEDETAPKKKLADLARELTRNFTKLRQQELDELATSIIEESKKKLTQSVIDEARQQKDRIIREVYAPGEVITRVAIGLKQFFVLEGFSVECGHRGEGKGERHGGQHVIEFTIDWSVPAEKSDEEKVLATKVKKDGALVTYIPVGSRRACLKCSSAMTTGMGDNVWVCPNCRHKFASL